MAIDIPSLWDFSKPELSEQRFREAAQTAASDDRLILETQIARSFGLRGDFEKAREILEAIEPNLQSSSDEVKVRYYLELGRTFSSTAHDPKSLTDEVQEKARGCYTNAFEIAQASQLDYLAIDALHMMAVVDPAPEIQLEWDLKSLAYMEASNQTDAKRWEGSLRNNVGYALHLAGRYGEALHQFKLALTVQEERGNIRPIRTAYWMIAWTLRAMGRLDEALEIQLRMEKEWEADGEPSSYVYEELEQLYQALGEPEKAEHYALLAKQIKKT